MYLGLKVKHWKTYRIRQLDRIHIYMYMRDVYSTENGCLGFVWGLFIREPIAGMLAPLARAAREQLDPRASHAPPSRALPRRRSPPPCRPRLAAATCASALAPAACASALAPAAAAAITLAAAAVVAAAGSAIAADAIAADALTAFSD